MGGAGHAGPLLNDSIYLNPSFNSLLRSYGVSANYLMYSGGPQTDTNEDSLHGHNLNLSIQDGKSELFQAGVGYTVREDATFVHVGASHEVVERSGVGLGAKFVFPKGGRSRYQDLTFSGSYIPLDWLQTAVVVDNLIQTNEGKAIGSYREFILGTKFNVQSLLMIYFDPHYIPDVPAGVSSFGHESGIEFTVMQDFFLRTGFFKNATVPWQAALGRGYGFGAGWLAPRISFDYGLQRVTEPVAATSHNFGMTIYF